MGEALVGGLLSAGWAEPGQVVVTEVSPGRRAELSGPGGLTSQYPGLRVLDGRLPRASNAIVAVKPADAQDVCRGLGEAGVTRVLSIAAGVALKNLEAWCSDGCAVIRAMPNMAALVRAAATAIAAGKRPARPTSNGRLAS